jgi:hypothetical protein
MSELLTIKLFISNAIRTKYGEFLQEGKSQVIRMLKLQYVAKMCFLVMKNSVATCSIEDLYQFMCKEFFLVYHLTNALFDGCLIENKKLGLSILKKLALQDLELCEINEPRYSYSV